MSACPNLPGCKPLLNSCFCGVCVRECRCWACTRMYIHCWDCRSEHVLRAVSVSHLAQAAEQTLRSRQSTQSVHHASEPTRCRYSHPCRTQEAIIRYSAIDSAVEAQEASASSSRGSAAASRMPTGGHSATAYSLSCRAAAPANISTRADTQHSLAAHPLRADDDQV